MRRTITEVIRQHLQPDARARWTGHDFDFTGAVFDGGNFNGAVFSGGRVRFNDATFSGGTVSFEKPKYFDGLPVPSGPWPAGPPPQRWPSASD